MKIKQMIKWNWQNSYMGLIVLYGVFILLYLFAFAVNVSAGGETVNVNGMSTGSVVMMLVPVTVFIVTQSNVIETMSTSGMKE